MAKFRELLTNRNFFLLWLGQTISNFGDRLNQMALVALVYQNSPGSEMALAKLISFTIIPVFIIGPIAGVWVDRLNKKDVMIISDITRGVLVLSIPLFIVMKQILAVYLVIFILFSISRFFIPSKMAMIPEIVPKDKLLIANSLQDTTHIIGNVVGLVVAGVIVNIPAIGAMGGFYIDSLTFFVSASLIAMIVNREFALRVKEDLLATRQAIEGSIRRSIFAELKEGLGFFREHRNMAFVLGVFFILMAGIGAVSCVIIVFIQEAFGTATRDLGFLGMFLVAGLFLGTVLFAKFGQKIDKRKAILASFIASGLFLALFAFFVKRYPSLPVAGIFSGLIGLAIGPVMMSANTLTHEMIPEDVRGRVFSSLEAVIHLAFLTFMFIAAFAAGIVGRFWVLVAVGILFSASGLAGFLLWRRPKTT